MIAARHETGEDMPEPKTMLLVDDELDILELYTLVLESAGFRVVAVSSAAAALERLAAQPVDLVITDYQMPEMHGDQLLGIIREQYPGLPTILASGLPNVVLLAHACGADGYYQKSSPTAHLIQMVRAVLNGAAHAQASLD